MRKLASPWVFASVILALLGLVVWMSALSQGLGTVAYGLDDAYIHLAIAKNLAAHGVWGPTPYQAVSASSSPGWILILTILMKVLGNHAWFPFILDLLAAIGLSYMLDRLLTPYIAKPAWRTAAIVFVLLVLPAVTYVAIGMEHILQVLLVAIFFGFARKIFAPEHTLTKKSAVWLWLLTAGMVLVRVECAVLLPIPFICALMKKDYKAGIALAGGPITALLLFAAIASIQGFPIEPNSMAVKRIPFPTASVLQTLQAPSDTVLNKARAPGISDPFSYYYTLASANISEDKVLECLFLVLVGMLVILLLDKGRNASKLLLSTCILGFALHAVNGEFGWFYRYEGYLIVFSLLSLAAVVWESWKLMEPDRGRSYVLIAAACLSFTVLGYRGFKATSETPTQMANIGHQQLQMARFVAAYYPQGRILINDIGAISYYSDPHITDDIGLGTNEVARWKVDRQYTMQKLEDLMAKQGVELSIIYQSDLPPPGLTFNNAPPWIQVGGWAIPNALIVHNEVDFFGTSQVAAEKLYRNLKTFEPELPKDVAYQYANVRSGG